MFACLHCRQRHLINTDYRDDFSPGFCVIIPSSPHSENAHEIFRQNLSKSIVKVVTNFFTGNCAVCGKFLTHFLRAQQGRASIRKKTIMFPLVCFLIAVIYESVSSFWSWLFGRPALSIQMCPAPVICWDKLILIYIHRGQVSLNYCYPMTIPCQHH